MNKTLKLLLFIFITIGVSFIIYQSITQTPRNDVLPMQGASPNHIKSSSNVASQTEFTPPSSYVFSSPSNGSLTKTINISITHNADNTTASGTIETPQTPLNIGQDVILYSTENEALPFAGKISKIDKNDTHSTVTMGIPKEIKDVLKIDTLSNKAEIVIFATISSQRYPYSALQKDKNGNHFVWSIKNPRDNTNGIYSLNKTWVDNPTFGLNYFIAGKPINAYSYVILNPDSKLKDDTNYKASEITFEAPLYSPIKQALIDHKQKLKAIKKQQRQKEIDDCRKKSASKQPLPNVNGSGSTSCKANTEEKTTDDIIKFILSR